MTANQVAHVLGAAPRVGLDDLGDADLQQRVDRKYLIDLDRLGALAERLTTSHALLEIDGLSGFSYRSSYLDTPQLDCYHAHRQDRRLRWKARTRLYADSGRCRFEVKLKTGRGDTDKHALVIPADVFGTVPQQAQLLLGQVLATRYRQAAPTELAPSLTVAHHRSTLVACDGSSRVTLDSDLVFTGPDDTTGRLHPALVLVETKSRDGRSTADRLLREAGVRPVSVSKYCAGIALTRPELPEQPWRPLLRRHFTQGAPVAAAA